MLLLLHLESSGTIVFHEGNDKKITRQQVWQSFIQESICSIAAMSNTNIELQDGLKIDDVTKEAFNVLGENGIEQLISMHLMNVLSHIKVQQTHFLVLILLELLIVHQILQMHVGDLSVLSMKTNLE